MKGIQPHLWVEDVTATARFYREALGFDLSYWQPKVGPWDFCILTLNECGVMLAAFPPSPGGPADLRVPGELAARKGQRASCALYCEVADVDAHHGRALLHGARIIEKPEDRPWGLRQYTLEDPTGQLWTFFASLEGTR